MYPCSHVSRNWRCWNQKTVRFTHIKKLMHFFLIFNQTILNVTYFSCLPFVFYHVFKACDLVSHVTKLLLVSSTFHLFIFYNINVIILKMYTIFFWQFTIWTYILPTRHKASRLYVRTIEITPNSKAIQILT